MPVLIPLAINTGFYIDYLIRRFKDLKDKREVIPVYFNFGLIGLIAIAIPIVGYIFLGDNLEGNWFRFITISLITVVIGIMVFIQLKKKQLQPVFLLTVGFYISLLAISLPLSKALTSDNYKPISELKHESEVNGLKVYGFNYVSPEMIWQFGSEIPPIKTENGTFNFPKEDTFGMLANGISPEDQETLLINYDIEEITTYDLNVADTDSKKYNGRLVNYFYILTKK